MEIKIKEVQRVKILKNKTAWYTNRHFGSIMLHVESNKVPKIGKIFLRKVTICDKFRDVNQYGLNSHKNITWKISELELLQLKI